MATPTALQSSCVVIEIFRMSAFPSYKVTGKLAYVIKYVRSQRKSSRLQFMVAEAIRLAELGGKVLYLLFSSTTNISTTKETLLFLDLQEKFKNHSNIEVKTVLFKDGDDNELELIGQGFDHIMADELFEDFHQLTVRKKKRDIDNNKICA